MQNIDPINRKLADLFNELELDPSPPTPVEKPTSWTWKCDNQGYYTACSPEVKEILGTDSYEFIGKPLSSFLLTPQSSRKLEVLLGTLTSEGQLNVQFRNQTGYSIPIQMSIRLTQLEDTDERILCGMNTILSGS
jgi:PAS domain-containing protein